jgi:hypothetical protein
MSMSEFRKSARSLAAPVSNPCSAVAERIWRLVATRTREGEDYWKFGFEEQTPNAGGIQVLPRPLAREIATA